ncbi:MAG: HlyD family efflux transporter periplasmic adaptor subunit [Eubacteriaceae bacterium]|nr:HlyD family efflux transporter periplasmic adaptor subunit [Eubacteriaceae bacterium]
MKLSKLSKRNKIIIIAAIILIPVIFFGIQFIGRTTTSSSDVTYGTATVEKGTITTAVTGSGSLAASSTYEVKSLANAEIESIQVSEGDTVVPGDILAVLNSDSAKLALDKAQLAYDQAVVAKANIEKQMSSLTIVSTASGIITKSNISLYQNIQKGTSAVEITDDSTMEGKVYFASLSLLNQFTSGQAVSGTTASGKSLGATITDIDPSDNSAVLKINNSSGVFKNGTSEIITISGGELTYTSLQPCAIEYLNSPISVVAKAEGEISKINYTAGNRVSNGAAIALINGDSLKTSLANQTLTVKEAALNLKNAKKTVESLNIAAEQGGTVSAIALAAGDIAAGSIMTITNYDKLNVVISVDELDLDKIKAGQEADITSDVYSDQSYTGIIKGIALEGVAQNGVSTFDVTIELADKGELKAGMTANIDIIIQKSENILKIPVDAIQKDDKGYFVYKTSQTDSVTADVLAQSKTYIKTGISDDAYTEVTSGLAQGDVVIYEQVAASTNTRFPGMGSTDRQSTPPDGASAGKASSGQNTGN